VQLAPEILRVLVGPKVEASRRELASLLGQANRRGPAGFQAPAKLWEVLALPSAVLGHHPDLAGPSAGEVAPWA